MANNIDIKQIVSSDAIKGLEKVKTELRESNELLTKQLEILGTLNKEYAKSKSTIQLKETLNKQEQTNLKIQQEKQKIVLNNNRIESQTVAATIKQTKETERLNKAEIKKTEQSKKAAIAAEKQNRAYTKLSQKYTLAANKAKDLAVQYGVNSKQARKAAVSARKYGNQLKKVDASVGQHSRKVGSYFGSMIKGAVSLGASYLGMMGVIKLFSSSIKTIANFEKSMSKVKAVTGATDKEFNTLSNDAKRLGSITSKSATEVSGLQLEFAKLGFSTAEILNATEATISLSIAAGSDLAESAVVAASTIKGFGLDASETQRVVDVMAKSFSSSALDLEKFKTSMAAVAPIAKANGKDIEFVTARLSVLSDAGLDASTSGTSLRNMFLELSKRGLTWEQGLAKINKSTNKNVTALNLFGKRGATAALILADNTKEADKLEKAYDNASGSAEEMATIMEDNLIGDTKELSSAWEGFVLSLNKGDGVISKVFRKLTQYLTGAIQGIIFMNQTISETQAKYGNEWIGMIKKNVREQIVQYKELYNNRIDMLNRFVKDGRITEEKAKASELKYLKEYETKKDALLTKSLKAELFKAKQVVANVEYEKKYSNKIQKFLEKEGFARITYAQKIEKQDSRLGELLITYDRSVGIIPLIEDQLQSLSNAHELNTLNINNEVDANDNLNTKIEKQKANYSDLIVLIAKIKQQIALTDKTNVTSLDSEITLIDELLASEKALLDAKIKTEKAGGNDPNKIAEYETKKIKLETDSFKKKEEISKKIEELKQGEVDALLKMQKDYKDKSEKTDKEIEDKAKKRRARELRRYRKNKNDELKKDKEIAAAKKMIADQATNTTNALFDLKQSQLNAELDALQNNYAARIEAADGDNEEQERLAKELAEKQYAIQLELAKSEKNQALFNIAISTAQGVAAAWVNPIAGPVLSALVLAAGLAQAAAVQAQPLPQPPEYALGTDNSESTFIAGEKGRELMMTKSGELMLTPNHATLYQNMEGTQVLPSAQTDSILSVINNANVGAYDTQMIGSKLDMVARTIKANATRIDFDKDGIFNTYYGKNKIISRANKFRN